MLNKRSWKERLRGDVRITLPERPEIVGGYASCERFLPEERRPVRAWMAAGAVCAAVLIVLAAVAIPYVAGSLPKGPGIGPGAAVSFTGMEEAQVREAFAAYWAENGAEPWSADAFGFLGTCGGYAAVTYTGPGDAAVHSVRLDGYTFLSPATYSPSPLGIYIVRPGRVSTLEAAVADGSVQAADVWRMLPADRRRGDGAFALTTAATTAQTPSFCAIILENLNGSYLVKPEAGFPNAGERMHVSAPKDAPVFKVGDRVTIYYDGQVMATYPLQINALRIEACPLGTTTPQDSDGSAAAPTTTAATAQTPSFCAVVLEKLNSSYMVRPEADFKYAGERVHISVPKDAPVFEAGDRITVYYDGRIMESYPPQVNALRIEAGHIRTTRQSAPAS